MALNGLSLRDFESSEAALEVADQLIAQSIEEHGHQYAMISYGNALTDRYFYVESKGRPKTWTSSHTKTLSRANNAKTLKAIQAAGVADELLDGTHLVADKDTAEVPKTFEKLKALADVGRLHRWASM